MDPLGGAVDERHLGFGQSTVEIPAHERKLGAEQPNTAVFYCTGGPPHGLVDERCLADASRSPDQDGGASLPVGQTGADQGQLTVPSDE